jgi:hypothetical protein
MTRNEYNNLKDGDKVQLKGGVLRVVRLVHYTNGVVSAYAENASGKGKSQPIHTEDTRPDGFSHYSKWTLLSPVDAFISDIFSKAGVR